MKAYMLLIIRPGSEIDVAEKLNQKKEVETLDVVYGDYDIILTLNVTSMEKLKDFTYSLRSMREIERSSTMIATD